MEETAARAIAIVGVGAVLPDAPTAPAFWDNVKAGRYSIRDVPPTRWDPALYYDPDPKAPDKTYSRIGAFVDTYEWNPVEWKVAIPPRVAEAMDETQKWAVACTRQVLDDYGYPRRPLDTERTAVIVGSAMAGERHYVTAMRIAFPELARELGRAPSFEALPAEVRAAVQRDFHARVACELPPITEDTMPGELANCIAGRIANLFNLRGPNYVCDAACASALAAIDAAAEGLIEGDFDAVVTGGIDRNMGASTYVKFCKIGALSATGTRPYADGADGFVMGEGAAMFLLKRLADAERAGDRIYAVLRGVGGASDGRGKGITAPNPAGQRLAIERGWRNAGLDPATVSLVEGHGTSTRVGDVVEVQSLIDTFGGGLRRGSIPLGSVKSNIGHLKGAAGAAGLLKAAYALHHALLPPSLNCVRPNPDIDFARSPFFVNTELREWPRPACGVRRATLSAFGFGGTNFHMVLEEHVPARLTANDRGRVSVAEVPRAALGGSAGGALKPPLRGVLVVGASDERELAERVRAVAGEASAGRAPEAAAPLCSDLHARERLALDYGDAGELAAKAGKALNALAGGVPAMWRALRHQGVFRGRGPAPKVAFLYPGQGSQYVDMARALRAGEPLVAEVFDEADRVMTPLLGRTLSSYLFVESGDGPARARAEEDLKQTAITQPAVLAVDVALTRLLQAYGVEPDMVMGHSLGEYAALVAAGVLTFADALEAVSARGREMTRVSMADNGRMAAVMAPIGEIEQVLAGVGDDVVVANYNSSRQAVIGGATPAVEAAVAALRAAGYSVVPLQVSHAFHTRIVAAASAPLRRTLERLGIHAPRLPVVANIDGAFYPTGPGAREQALDMLARQVAAPVQFVKGLRTLRAAGAGLFVEVGPKKALHGFVEDLFADDPAVLSLFTNSPRLGDVVAFNQALCGLYAAGLGAARDEQPLRVSPSPAPPARIDAAPESAHAAALTGERYQELGRVFAELLERGMAVYQGGRAPAPASDAPVVISGAGLGLPGGERVFDDDNVARILRGDQLIGEIPARLRRAMADKHVVRLVKSEAGESHFAPIDDVADVIKLAGRGGTLDLQEEFGLPAERIASLDVVTQLAIGAGLEALRDAGIPLVMRYKTTTRGTRLHDRWGLPEALRDETGVIFASAFPGYDALTSDMTRYHLDRAGHARLDDLLSLRAQLARAGVAEAALVEIDRRVRETRARLAQDPFVFDRRFLFRILAMGHSQFAELVGARGPNTQINAACASTTQGLALAEDWIRAGRCRRVVLISGDDVSSDNLMEWIGAGFLATGAAATDASVETAALPFDRRRHGMIVGMGAAALVVESAEALRERGVAPICEVLSTTTANSAYHGTRLSVAHISQVMERLVASAERRWGLARARLAPETVFVSHETYTPARGGSAAAEVHALRHVFGAHADRIVMANTKGLTGHAMGVGIEDVVAVKTLETGLVPPLANFKEVDPALGVLNLSHGGPHAVRYALRLAAGFGSQIALSLLRWVAPPDGRRRPPDELGFAYRVTDAAVFAHWLARLSGYPRAQLEVVKRTLRVKDEGAPPARAAVAAPLSTPLAPATPPAPAPASVAPAAHAAVSVTPARAAAPAVTPTPGDPVRDKVLALVADKTGYPPDMLALDLDLEADLGIDTVKQAELFTAVREEWNIPRDDNRKLRDYPTLQHVIGFVHAMRPDLAATAQAPPSEAVAPTTAQAPALTPAPGDPVRGKVLALVADKTGYPPDMLALDLDLEADLGIDTVKQAELFTAVREEWNIPRDDNRKLRDYPTLQHVIGFVHAMRPDLAATAQAPPSEAVAPSPPSAPARPVPAELAAAEGVPRRVPVTVVRPPLALCKTTGVTLDAGRRVLVVGDRGGVGKPLVRRLEKLGCDVLVVNDAPTAEELAGRIEAWLAAGVIHGVYWLPALDPEGDLAALDLAGWREALRLRVKLLYTTMRALYAQVSERGTFLVAATRLGGRHGYDDDGAVAPLGGAVTGFTKAYKRERPEALVKTVDFEPSRKTAELAGLLIDETLRDPGAVEIGYRDGLRTSVALEVRPACDGQPGLTLGPDSVFVVTGAAGGIVSAITADLAAASGGTFHLLDLVPEPDPADPDLARFTRDKEGLKRDLFARLQARGERATPALVERDLARLERSLAALRALEAVRAAGGTAHWYSVDLRDAEAVERALAPVRAVGRVDALLHGAGLEVSHLLSDKEPAEFERVFDVKCDGWWSVLHALRDVPLGAAVAFSSIAARFGNLGQSDYSAANDLLCKCVSSFRTTRPQTRGLAIDWTAWGDVGMATRGSIPRVMERAGIDLLPASVGVPVVRRELTAGGTRGELVIAGRLGSMLEEWDASGGLDLEAVSGHSPMIGRVRASSLYGGLLVETELDPAACAFLHDHQIEGTPVLPGVMGIESFAAAARLLLPGWHVTGVEGVDFLAPFKFYRHAPRTLRIEAWLRPAGGRVLAECSLVGERTLPGQAAPQVTTHFRARIVLSPEPTEARRVKPPRLRPSGAAVSAKQIYGLYFHGPAYRVLESAWRDDGTTVGRMAAALPPDGASDAGETLMAPRVIELCFQTAGLLEVATRGRLGLPLRVAGVQLVRSPAQAGGARLHALVTPAADTGGPGGAFDARVVDASGQVYLELRGYRTVALPGSLDAQRLKPFQAAMA